MRDYGPDVPFFIQRFGPAYKSEVLHFVEQCQSGEPFRVTHREGLEAMLVAELAARALRGGETDRLAIDYEV